MDFMKSSKSFAFPGFLKNFLYMDVRYNVIVAFERHIIVAMSDREKSSFSKMQILYSRLPIL